MKLLKAMLATAIIGGLAGCVAVPVEQPYYAAPAAPAYYPAPVYYGPAVGIGVYGGWRGGHRHWRHHG